MSLAPWARQGHCSREFLRRSTHPGGVRSLSDQSSTNPRLRPSLSSPQTGSQSTGYARYKSSRALTPQHAHRGQPHVLVLIDGDGYVFSNDLILMGRQGGVNAATEIEESVRRSLDYRFEYRLSVYLILSSRAILRHVVFPSLRYTNPGAHKAAVWRDYQLFLHGFMAPPSNFLVDVGMGKERVDTKIKALFSNHIQLPETEYVVLGVAHDNGYAPMIEGEVLPEFRNKIKLLQPYGGDLAVELASLNLPVISANLFQKPEPPGFAKHAFGSRFGPNQQDDIYFDDAPVAHLELDDDEEEVPPPPPPSRKRARSKKTGLVPKEPEPETEPDAEPDPEAADGRPRLNSWAEWYRVTKDLKEKDVPAEEWPMPPESIHARTA